ncbi:MAG TPA: nuclear transport factor 2 family protein [Pseudonocardia sp.]|jgi:ketosteroid isomerase-like protein
MTTTESVTEKNRAIVEELYGCVAAGTPEKIAVLMAEDVVILEPGYLPFGKTWRGQGEFGELFGAIGQFLDLSEIRVNYLIADGDRVAAALSIRDLENGEWCDLIEQSTLRDGKIVELKLFYHEAQTMIGKPKVV